MNKKFYVFLTLITLIIFPFFLQGAERVPISPDKLKIEPTSTFLPTKDNHVIVTATFPLEAVHPGGSAKFRLLSSSWPGYCMNAYYQDNPNADYDDDFDADPRNTDFDMSIIPANQPDVAGATWNPPRSSTEKLQEITLSFGNDAQNLPSSLALRIESYDYGSIAKLHVTLKYNNQIEVENSAMVPIDEDFNYIADYWQENVLVVPSNRNVMGPLAKKKWTGKAADDLESGPHTDTQKGDGITAVEEYRGFEVSDKTHTLATHKRPSTLKKDLFLYLEDRQYDFGWVSAFPPIFKPHHSNLEQIGSIGTRHMNRTDDRCNEARSHTRARDGGKPDTMQS